MKSKRIRKTIATILPLPVELLDEICFWVKFFLVLFRALIFPLAGPTTPKWSQPFYTLFSVAPISQPGATSTTFTSQNWGLQYSGATTTSPTEVVIPRRMCCQHFCQISDVRLYFVLSVRRSCKSTQSDRDCNAQAPQSRNSVVQES